MKEPIISISGIRGILGESLYPENIIKYTKAFANYSGCKRIVIGRDGRLHGDLIEKITEVTLLLCGCEVIKLGAAPTPTISLAVPVLKAKGGISITASHNPQQWNGLKFLNRNGIFLDEEENSKFLELFGKESCRNVNWKSVKQVEYYPYFFDYHINRVLEISTVDVKKIRRRKFKVVVDCVNSSGSVIIPRLLKKLGCEVVTIDCDSSGIFTRNPEPVPENLKKASAAVKKHKADLAVVVDPDADRLVIITEKGEPFGEENTITTVVNRVLKNIPAGKRTAVINLSTSRSVDDTVKTLNGKLYKSPVGEVNVIKKMKEVNAAVGGEGSGGVILPEVHYSRDALAGVAIILSELADFGGKVSEYKRSLPQYHILKTKIDISNVNPDELIDRLKKRFSESQQNDEDGLRIDFEDSWVNFRKSNTEPIMRIITEARTKKEARELQKSVLSEIKLNL